MRMPSRAVTLAAAVAGLVVADTALAQSPLSDTPLNQSALRPRGQNVIPVYDGWFENPDGSFTFCFGYFNLNTEEAVEVPLGPGNRLEPSVYDGAQPTHFDPVPDPELTSPYRHHWCVFTVTVPLDFGRGDVVWTLASQGDTLSVPAAPGRYAVAPYVRLDENGARAQGRRGVRSGPRRVSVGEPLTLTAWIEHEEPGTWVGWTKHQGPGPVTFGESELRLDAASGAVTSTATFERAGRYLLRLQAINDTEIRSNPTYGFEFHCCWTNGYVEVDVVE
jgi:hypothetical protein